MSTALLLLSGLLAVAPAPDALAPDALAPDALASLELPGPLSGLRFVEADGRPGQELLEVQADGRVSLWTFVAREDGQGALEPLGAPLQLPEPERCLLDLVDLLGRGRPQLVVLDGSGLRLHELGPEGVGEALSLARRATLEPRTAVPAFADFVRDVGGDGVPDVVVPAPHACELWLAEPAEDGSGPPRLRKAATLLSPHTAARAFGAERLSDVLSNRLVIPDLATEDVNGDGREDLVVSSEDRRAFHLQAEDGSFPAEPTVEIDLSLFRDTSPRPDVRPGEIVSSGDQRSDTRRDLDGDGIPDHVIAHRRKVWVFHGTPAGPQFREPSTVLKVAEDVTGLAVLPVDEDPFPDLVLLKVELPGIAELVMGVLGEWEVRLRVIGYRNVDGRSFSTSPEWRVEHELRLPPLLDVVRNPERFLRDFEDVQASVQAAARGDLDGDGARDLVLVKSEGRDAQPWIGIWSDRGDAGRDEDLAGDAEMRQLLFESEDTDWDLERVAGTVASLAGARLEALTGGREPDARLELRSAAELDLVGLVAADVDGDGRDELAVLYADPLRPRSARLDLLRRRP